MRVLVRVKMRGSDADGKNAAYLCGKLVVNRDLAREQRCDELGYCDGQRAVRRKEAAAADQHQMAANIESGDLGCTAHSVIEGLAVGHQRGRSEDTAAVRLENALVYVGRESKVIRVDYQLLQNRPSLMRRNFLGLAWMSLRRPWVSRATPF